MASAPAGKPPGRGTGGADEAGRPALRERGPGVHVAGLRAGVPGIALATMLAACMVPGLPRAAADEGQRVYRCVGANGEIAFSGLPCSAPQAALGLPPAASEVPGTVTVGACATDRDELVRRLQGAVARQDANALAALVDWRGVGAGVAAVRMSALERLVKLPLLGVDEGSDSIAIRTGSGGNYAELHFTVAERAACLWLDWQAAAL